MAAEVAEAAGHTAECAPTPSAYIAEHLQSFNSIDSKQASVADFSIINWDTVFWSVLIGLIGIIVLGIAVHRAVVGAPGRFQAFAELVVEVIDGQTKGIIHGDRSWTTSLVPMVSVQVALMNVVDLIPIDWVMGVSHLSGTLGVYIPCHRTVATANLDGMFGMSFAVPIPITYYSFKIKGAGGFAHGLLSTPSGTERYLTLFNLVLNIIEFLAKAMLLGMRLFGSMYVGELVFLPIALLGLTWTSDADTSALGFVGHVMAGIVWAIFHILIVLLQAFIFVMLTPTYIGQAHERH